MGDVELALLRARRFAIAACGKDTQRQIVDAGEHITHSHATARQTENFIELPTRVMDSERSFSMS